MIRANLGAFTAAVLFGLAAVAVSVAVEELAPTSVAVFRYAPAALLLPAAFAFRARLRLRARPRQIGAVAVLGLLYFTLFPLAYNSGLRFADVSRASLMLGTVPLWSALFARRWGERLSGRQWFGLLLSLAGVGAVLAEQGLRWDGGAAALLGCALVLLAAIFVSIYGVAYNALARGPLADVPPLAVAGYAMAFGTLFTLPAALVDGLVADVAALGGATALAVLYLGVFGGGVAVALWTAALRDLSPTRVAVYLHLNPVVATIAGALLLGERLSGAFLLGFVVVVAGVTLVHASPPPRAWRRHGVTGSGSGP